jgi:hypothetical protein
MAVVPSSCSRQRRHSPDHAAITQQSPAQTLPETKRQQYQRWYHQTHRVQIAATRRARYRKNPAPALEANRTWVAKNRERRRAYQKRWYQQKLETLRRQHRDYFARFRERELTRSREYYRTHRAAVRARQRRYYLRRKAAKQSAVSNGL